MPFDSAPCGSVLDGARACTLTSHSRSSAPAVLDRYRVRSLCRTGRPLFTKNDFSIRLVGEARGRTADALVTKMYQGRGYLVDGEGDRRSTSQREAVTLEALNGRTTVGTLTVNLGTSSPLNAEILYPEEIAPYRHVGRRPWSYRRAASSRWPTARDGGSRRQPPAGDQSVTSTGSNCRPSQVTQRPPFSRASVARLVS